MIYQVKGISGYVCGVRGCGRVCTGMRGCAWICTSVCICEWDELSEFLLENRVPTSADFNTYPIQIFFYRALAHTTYLMPTKMARHSFTLPGFNNLLFDNR